MNSLNEYLLYTILVLLLVLAALVVATDRLFTAVIYAGALSACIAFCYLLLGAPDVALAEAVIGSALTTVIFLAALKKYRIFTIRCLPRDQAQAERLHRAAGVIIRSLAAHDLEAHVIDSQGSAEELLHRPDTDLVMELPDDKIILHAEAGSQYTDRIGSSLSRELPDEEILLTDSSRSRITEYKGESS